MHVIHIAWKGSNFVLLIGVPSLLYGLALSMLVKFHEDVVTPAGTVRVHFLNEEDRDSPY